MMEGLGQDLRYGFRSLVRAPEFALVAVLTLGLGIGANTAIFSVVDGVLLEPLPYRAPGEILWLLEQNHRGDGMSVAWSNFQDWHRETGSFASLAAYGTGSQTILGSDRPRNGRVTRMTGDFWDVFEAGQLRGRLTHAEDHLPGAAPVAVVSETFWRNALGGEAVDQLLETGGRVYRVVGVVDDGFDFPSGTEVWIPVLEDQESTSRTAHNWRTVGRLAPGVTREQAHQELESLTARLVQDSPDADPRFLAAGVQVQTLHERLVGSSQRPLYLLLGAAGLVLLVACTNLAGTLLARGAGRARELAVRASLGASRGRVVRQLLAENLVLALAGAGVGVVLARAALWGLKLLGPASVPRLEQVEIDGSVLLFTAALSLATVLLVGLMPARRLTRAPLSPALRDGGRGSSGDARGRIWRVLVGGEVALALFLLAGSGLVVRSFQNLVREDGGFDGGDVTTQSLSLSRVRYDTPAAQARWYARYTDALEALPGISAAGVITSLPLQGAPNARLELDGDLQKTTVGNYVLAGAGAFEALDIPLVQGRLFDERDGPDGVHVAVVSRRFAEENWPGEDPIGKSVTGGGMDEFWEDGLFAEVVGVVEDVRYRGLDTPPGATVYFHYPQRPMRLQWGTSLVAEAASGDAAALAPVLRAVLQDLDPDVPPQIRTMEDRLRATLAPRRFTMLLLGGFAGLSLALAFAGIYGVVSYQVARRRREMGIRLALGGRPASVRGMVVRQSLTVVAVGISVGAVGVMLGGEVIRTLLYGVEPRDPLILVGAALLLSGAALLASWVPAHRGTQVDPALTMRAD